MVTPPAVAIIGMGARFPGAADLPAFRDLVRGGQVHVTRVPAQRWHHGVVHSVDRKQPNKTPAQCGAFVDNIDHFAPEFFGVTPRRARIMDPQQRLMLEISRQALEDAGYARRPLAGGRVGVYVGASSSDHRMLIANAVNLPCDLAGRCGIAPELTADVAAAVSAALPPIQAYSIVGQQLNMIAANVSQAFDFKGPAFAVDTACSSALTALHEAVLHLRGGIIDAAVVGGVYVQLDPVMMVCFSRIGALSFTDECRPFEAAANGFVLGEGVGAVVIKRLDDALRDGDRIVAVIRGIAMNNDGRAAGPLTPDANGQSAVIQAAWRDAGLDPATVGLLEAHATATPAGDGVELAALQTVFGCASREAPIPVTSIKANIGHGLASAGMASLLKASLAVHEGFVAPQPVRGPLRPELGEKAAFRVPTRSEAWKANDGMPRRAGVSAFGFGGTNVHVVLEAAPEPSSVRAAARTGTVAGGTRVYRFEASAPTPALLTGHLQALADVVRDADADLADVSFTLAQRRRDSVQVAFAATDRAAFVTRATEIAAALSRGDSWSATADGEIGQGRLVTLPPSPLSERRFWLIDDSKKRGGVTARGELANSTAAMLNVSSRLDLVVSAIVAVTSWRPDEVKPEHRLVGDLGFDSLTTLEFMTALGRTLPGLPPPPRTIFTTTLTVAELAAYLDRALPSPEASEGATTEFLFERARYAWLSEHRPAGRPLLPMAALVHAAVVTLQSRFGAGIGIGDFQVLAPIEVVGDRVVLHVESASDGTFRIRRAPGGAPLATGSIRPPAPAQPSLENDAGQTAALSLPNFYAEFGFHGPALQALVQTPVVGTDSTAGWIRADADDVVRLDGALQLALYWLAATRRETAVATGFSDFRVVTAWPADGAVKCVAQLTGEGGDTLRGDFDFSGETGAIIAQWRGVEARRLDSSPGTLNVGTMADWPEISALASRKEALASAGLAMPYFHSHEGVAAATTRIAGREYINFSSYNYLGLAGAADVRRAAVAALERYGTSASASRVASGERPIHRELERSLAAFLGCNDALALVSGHATNVSVIGHLFGPEDLVVHDQLAHDCIVTGARLSGARRLAFPHNDVAALEHLLARERSKARRVLIAVEGVYSMDGDLAPLPAIVALKRRYDAVLLLDEAHSFGVLGATGRGAGEHFGVPRDDVDLWMGTLSKALASCGGYLAGDGRLIDYLRFTLPGFVYSVGLSPADAGAGLAALQALARRPELPRRLQERSEFFRRQCLARGVNIGSGTHSAVVPCLTGASERALRLAQALGGRGINVQPIFHPAVEEGRARLRFFITAEHSEEQLRTTASVLAEELAVLNDGKVGARA